MLSVRERIFQLPAAQAGAKDLQPRFVLFGPKKVRDCCFDFPRASSRRRVVRKLFVLVRGKIIE